jgi:two-component system cell cycle sensor histidine kinase/response regulator CckA
MKSIEILLVENSPGESLAATEVLQRARVLNKVHTVANTADAMSFLQREGRFQMVPRPDLILLDLSLPDQSGCNLLAAIKASEPLRSIQVAAMINSFSEKAALEASGLRADCYVTKPLDFAGILQVIHTVAHFWFEVMTTASQSGSVLNIKASGSASFDRNAAPLVDAAPIETLRVLLIEDNATEVLLLRRALRDTASARFSVTPCERLSEALTRLQTDRFDIILTDLALPDSRGLETFLKLQTEAKEIPIIVLTSLDDEGVGIKALQSGAQDYLIKKDLHGGLLVRAIRYALERRQLEHQLRQWQRMEAVGQLAGGVAHDFNNLLTIIEGYASLILDCQEIGTPARKILNAALRAKALTRQLLAFGRKQVMHSRSVDLNEILAEMTKLLAPAVREDIRLEFDYGSNLPPVHADAGMVEQVLLNLVVNARDAMPTGGTLSISTGLETLHEVPLRRKSEVVPGKFVFITVSDTGIGIAPEVLPRIFEPFFTTKEVGKGTGLGLATVYGIVKQHRGWIDVQSEPGCGATFRVFFPAALPPSASNRVVHSVGKVEHPRGRETILVAEDDPDLRLLVTAVLKQHGYNVLEASQGKEALAIWNQERDEISLLLTDMVMPDGISGRDLAAKVRADNPALKILFTSGYSSDIFGQALTLNPGEAFLQKPFAPADLLKAIRGILDGQPALAT